MDRVDNTRGYCPDNIVIVSTIANQAKSDLDLAGLIKHALGKGGADDLLKPSEWIQMVRFYYRKMNMQKPLCFCRLLAESEPLYDQIVFLQLFKNQEKRASTFLKHLEKYSGKDSVCKAKKLTHKRVYHRADLAVEVLYDSPKLYRWVQDFKKTIMAHSTEFDSVADGLHVCIALIVYLIQLLTKKSCCEHLIPLGRRGKNRKASICADVRIKEIRLPTMRSDHSILVLLHSKNKFIHGQSAQAT